MRLFCLLYFAGRINPVRKMFDARKEFSLFKLSENADQVADDIGILSLTGI
jgi:hypothetical protein